MPDNMDYQEQCLQLAKEEIETCRKVAERHPKNYYAWTHRRYLWSVIDPTTELLREEWQDMLTKWLPQHVSDHSAAHYGAQVLDLWMTKSKETTLGIAEQILPQVTSLVERQQEFHETLWILRRLVVRILLLHGKEDDTIRKLVEKDLEMVYQEASSNLHAWTYLVWVVRLEQGGLSLNHVVDLPKAISVLQKHPKATHEMWNIYGSTILEHC
jgi:hypothetical protein